MTSGEDPSSQKDDSLIDFLYVDRARIASYFAQIFDDGVHVSTKKTSSLQSLKSDKVSGGLPKVIQGETASADTTQEAIERQFDAAWHVPLNLISELNERGFINPDIKSAALGQVVLFHGKVQIVDVRIVQRMWEPMIELQNMNLPSATSAQKKVKKETAATQKHLIKVVENLPHTLQLRGFNEENQVWSTLEPEYLTINATDLAFKHGISIPGQWTIIAIVDAFPETGDEELDLPKGSSEIELGMLQMMLMMKMHFGRQDGDFGITPLVIYREVTKMNAATT